MQDSEIDFSTVLGASMHDMKNSLCMLLQSIDTINDKIDHDDRTRAELAQIHYEIARVNSNLLQLLALYRNNNKSLPLNVEEHYLDEMIEELWAKNEMYIDNKGISCEYEIEEDLAWFFDLDLISNLLNDIVVNALRYTHTKILITAKKINNMLEIQILDDGKGYPEHMLLPNVDKMNAASLSQSRTGLGLYFATLIADAHTNNNCHGSINLNNGGNLGGSIFILRLP
ncbi:sensor histidine kinase [Pseudoalteromonas denitrificans]|uniref:histidine kinase n=1 Tax=Pseudoalteromonas denitrificans DSM 6059 TaxID=1123010 RepID=A0A1I1QTH0_9GAMM|nr:HAMP domain-containing sensor histidine kinase [Pseudoalteromonas denitrificans]SFD25411.1 signal transduction histidine kinase [Pseudoalteromonas denitrificans DSM 6059]